MWVRLPPRAPIFHRASNRAYSSRATGPASRRLQINIADVMFAQHGVERRQVLRHQLLKVLRRLVAPLLQLFLHGRLLRGGRKIRAALELREKVVDLLQQHRRPAAVVLPATGELELQQGSLDARKLLAEVVRGFADG